MTTSSIFSRVKHRLTGIVVTEEALLHSKGSDEQPLLEQIISVVNKKNLIHFPGNIQKIFKDSGEEEIYCVCLKKKNGLHRSENLAVRVKESYEGHTKAMKDFWFAVDEICLDTGLSRVEVLNQMPEDDTVANHLIRLRNELVASLENIEEEEKKSPIIEKIEDLNKQIRALWKQVKEQINTERLDKLDELYRQDKVKTADYYQCLVAHFLSGSRIVYIDDEGTRTYPTLEFTKENVLSLHIDLQEAFYNFIAKEISMEDDEPELDDKSEADPVKNA